MTAISTITRYRSTDGKEHTTEADAEERNAYLRVEAVLRGGWGGYSPGYDGPMPVSKHVYTAEELFKQRHKLRNMLLDLPEPAPEIIYRPVVETRYHWPLTLMGLSAAIGFFAAVWFL